MHEPCIYIPDVPPICSTLSHPGHILVHGFVRRALLVKRVSGECERLCGVGDCAAGA